MSRSIHKLTIRRIEALEKIGRCWWGPLSADPDAAVDGALAFTLAGLAGGYVPAEVPPFSSWVAARSAILGPLRAASFLLRSPDPVEEAALARIPCAPQLLAERAIAWVEHPGLLRRREGQADTLAAAVVATRWGDRPDGGNGVFSRAAFRLLHARFPDSAAAKQTKYWYN